MIEDKHLKRQFTMKDQVGSLEVGVENMTGRLDLNPNLSGDVSRRGASKVCFPHARDAT